ncbi:MAG: hypothetical protein IDH49_06570 [Gammaproteobacteria bacterium]|nr:hypothetical protein [Gammaproteobacteria bacterium]
MNFVQNDPHDFLKTHNYFNTDAAGPYKVEQIKFADGTMWDVTAIKAKVLVATEGADNLYGYATNDTLNGLGGNDFIDGRAGDDLIDGGTGTDTLYGVDGNDTMNGGADNDVLYGGNGIDTLNGGAGNDTLSGGLGSDVYLSGRGSGGDLLSDYDATAGNTDRLDIGAGVTTDQIWFRRVGSDLEMSVIGTGDKTTISGWYYGAAYHVEQFKTADGKMLLDSQVDSLVTAMAGFAPPTAGQTTLPPDYQTALNPVIAANWK